MLSDGKRQSTHKYCFLTNSFEFKPSISYSVMFKSALRKQETDMFSAFQCIWFCYHTIITHFHVSSTYNSTYIEIIFEIFETLSQDLGNTLTTGMTAKLVHKVHSLNEC